MRSTNEIIHARSEREVLAGNIGGVLHVQFAQNLFLNVVDRVLLPEFSVVTVRRGTT